jgi:phospholipid/cholesterol/gamma-HCH transport system ATP-binding protein
MAETSTARVTTVRRGIARGEPHIVVRDLTMAFGDYVLMHDLNFTVRHEEVFVIMGGSGSGKSTLLNHMIGLLEPARGDISYDDFNFTKARPEAREKMLRRMGVLYQGGALWSSMTLAENIGLPLEEFTDLSPREIRAIASIKLSLVGLRGFEDYYPSQISGGMQKRAGLARAMALDPEVLFFDEPSAGLDPISSRLLDDLILVTHELPSIFTIADNSIYLDAESRTMIAYGNPKELLAHPPDPKVHTFLTRGADDRHPG